MKALKSQQIKRGCQLPQYYTIKQSAERLNVSRSTVHRMMNDGILKRNKIGRRSVRVPAADVENLLAGEEEHV